MEGERRLHPEPETAPQEGDTQARRSLHEQQQQREGGESGGGGVLYPRSRDDIQFCREIST